MERLFNGIYLSVMIVVGLAAGFLMTARWPPGISPDQTLAVAAAVIAALGTWAVGIGAMHFAEASHKLRLAEVKKAEDAEFIQLRSQLINCQLAPELYDKIVKSGGPGVMTVQSRHTALHAILSLTPTGPISSLPALADKDRALAHTIDVGAAMLRVGATQFMERFPTTSPHDARGMAENFEHVIGQARSLATHACKLGNAQDAARGIKPASASESGSE
ncbi:hypothetical protein [Stenotrophomonas maltophilia]|uniref:hypothetical protein n=1 Tax=Stenotrophomonas maltophilia TaxID=40324 RepID=UPI0021D9ACD3|nr:hypothetical protein [Stenotrophomonas maltophilia]UXY46983.1 hypothetical protein N8888_11375 [Stenotrophomonas maltophilia]